jgi:hypothetical protein
VARAYFYFVTRYENRLSGFTTPEAKVVFTNDTYPALQNWILQLMLQWHKADPPSQKEINENAIAFVNQKNRNPFIDRPEYVTRIWGTDGTNCSTATGIAQKTVQTLNIFPNPANGQIQVVSNAKAGYLQYNLLDISGKTISTGTTLQSGTNAAITLPALSKGMYFLQMTDADGEIFAGSLISM